MPGKVCVGTDPSVTGTPEPGEGCEHRRRDFVIDREVALARDHGQHLLAVQRQVRRGSISRCRQRTGRPQRRGDARGRGGRDRQRRFTLARHTEQRGCWCSRPIARTLDQGFPCRVRKGLEFIGGCVLVPGMDVESRLRHAASLLETDSTRCSQCSTNERTEEFSKLFESSPPGARPPRRAHPEHAEAPLGASGASVEPVRWRGRRLRLSKVLRRSASNGLHDPAGVSSAVTTSPR